ncbi:MAG: TRAP transporter substrate-binding protein DctP [Parvularculales bacterium]
MKYKFLTIVSLLTAMIVATSAQATELRLSHQWSDKDIRHKVAGIIAAHVAGADVGLKIRIFGSGSLFRPQEQYGPLSRGELDMTVFPLIYAGDRQPAYNVTLMPGLVKNHDHAARLSTSPFMAELEKKMAADNVMVLVHGYLAGGFVGKDRCITRPSDIRGLRARAAGQASGQMLAGAGASIVSMASSEIYEALRTGEVQAANTSSSSFVSYRIYEQVKCYTPPTADGALWFMYQPLLMNRSVFKGLTGPQQKAILEGAVRAEAYYLREARKQDAASINVYRQAGVEITPMSPSDFQKWRDIAAETSYRMFVNEVPDGQKLLDLALAVE